MLKRILGVILISFAIVLAGCTQSGVIPEEDLEGSGLDAFNNITYIITVDQFWITPNPGGRWSYVGRQLQVTSNITTVVQIRLEPKSETGQSFESALENVTAEPYTIEETDDGVLYARGSSEVSDYIIFRDYPEYVVEISLFDGVTDDIDQQYINDWEIIALEGGLFFAE